MLGEGFADGGFAQELRLVDQASHQCRGTNLVDAARQTFGLFDDASHGIVGEERGSSAAGGGQVVPHVADRLGQIRMQALHERVVTSRDTGEQQRLQRLIDATDQQIDALVYELYGLTAEEIAIVEGSGEKSVENGQ